jgi:hypothetical protein
LFEENRSFSELFWDWIPTKGRSGGGGVLTGISKDRFDIGSRVEGTYVLQHCLWDKKLETKWILMNVYGAAQVENKEEFLSELASLCSKAKESYVVGVIST